MPRTEGGRARSGRIAADITPFVDRRPELAEIRRLLSTSRLVTLTGVGGAGKTRLAVRAGTELRRSYADGVWQVDLAGLASGSMLENAVAGTLELPGAAGGPTFQALVDHLADRELLLLLDNCEHLLDACAPLVGCLLPVAPRLRVLCTSRQPLGIVGENVWNVPPLATARATDAAVELFVARAKAASSRFRLTPDNRDTVIDICRRLDGLPLAIELAAAQLRTRSVEQLAQGLDGDFRLLATRHAMPAHHRTLTETFNWSFALCSPAERSAWARISVFTGGFGLDAAIAVCADEELPAGAFQEALAELVDKSIVVREEVDGRTRYRLLETVRQFGLNRLRATGEPEYAALRLRHRDWYLALAERFEADWFGPRQVRWLGELRTEWANLRTALDACFTTPGWEEAGLRMATALLYFWLAGGEPREGRHWLERALTASPQPTRARTGALLAFCRVLVQSDDGHLVGSAWAEEGLRLARRFGDPFLLAHAQYILGLYAQFTDDEDAALALLGESVEAYARLDVMDATVASAQFAYALTLLFAGGVEGATRLCQRCYDACVAVDDLWWRSQILSCMVVAALEVGDVERGYAHTVERLSIKRELGDTLGVVLALESMSAVAVAAGANERAARMHGAAKRIWEKLGQPRFGSKLFQRWLDGYIATAREALGGAAFDQAAAHGAELSEGEAIAEALQEPPPSRSLDDPHAVRLTRRERQVAELVAQALSNKQIATRLVISQRTAESHVESILNKLGLKSRTQVVAWLADHPTP
jgi:non-specific serine/threonine protein kinase